MKPTEQQIRSAVVNTGDLLDMLDRVSRKANAKAYGSTDPRVGTIRDATIAMCDGMKEELRDLVIQEFARAYGEPQGCPPHNFQHGRCVKCFARGHSTA